MSLGETQLSDDLLVEKLFDLTPAGMIKKFDMLNSDLYRRIPRNLFLDDYPWEKTDMAKALKKEAKVK